MPKYGAQEYQACTDTTLSGYQFTLWSSGASEIYFEPREIHVGVGIAPGTSQSAVERATT